MVQSQDRKVSEGSADVKRRARRGRPRKNGSAEGNQREKILEAAVGLFKSQGVAQTNMSQISRIVGLDQSSLYYWFKSKDDILVALAHETFDRNAPQITRILESDIPQGEEPLLLCALVYQVTYSFCDLPMDYHDLESMVMKHPADLRSLVDFYSSAIAKMNDLMAQGISNGSFRVDNPAFAVEFVFSLIEGVQHRFRLRGMEKGETEVTLRSSAAALSGLSKEDEARLTAASVCLALGTRGEGSALLNEAVARGLIQSTSSAEITGYYADRSFEFGWESFCRMELPDHMEGMTVLDICCRRGKGVYKLGDRVGDSGRAIGVDWSESYIDEARAGVERALEKSGRAQSNMEFYAAFPEDLSPMGLGEAYADMAYLNGVSNLLFNRATALAQAYRALKPGGMLVLEAVTANAERDEEVVRLARYQGNCVQAAPFRDVLLGEIAAAGFEAPEVVLSRPVAVDAGFKEGFKQMTVPSDERVEFCAEVLHLRKA